MRTDLGTFFVKIFPNRLLFGLKIPADNDDCCYILRCCHSRCWIRSCYFDRIGYAHIGSHMDFRGCHMGNQGFQGTYLCSRVSIKWNYKNFKTQ